MKSIPKCPHQPGGKERAVHRGQRPVSMLENVKREARVQLVIFSAANGFASTIQVVGNRCATACSLVLKPTRCERERLGALCARAAQWQSLAMLVARAGRVIHLLLDDAACRLDQTLFIRRTITACGAIFLSVPWSCQRRGSAFESAQLSSDSRGACPTEGTQEEGMPNGGNS